MFKKLTLSLLGAVALLNMPAMAATMADDLTRDPPALPVLETRDSYLIVTRQDMRKCMYPMCGGYYVKAVNKAQTRCADGSLQKECHAVQLNTTALGWTDDQRATFDAQFAQGQALVRGVLVPAPAGQFTADQLTITEAWSAQGKRTPIGTFYSVKDTGIRCITTPCPSLAATKLNSPAAAFNPDLDLSASGAAEKQIQAAYEALGTSGILTAGAITPVRVKGLNGKPRYDLRLLASQFYLPAKP